MQFRGFQAWLHDKFGDVLRSGLPAPQEIILDAGCGGGKSVAVVIIAHWLIEQLRVVDRVLWIVPNGSLRRQAAKAFGPHEVGALMLNHRIEIVEAGNEGNPAKGKRGYTITYAAAAAARLRGDGFLNPHVEELSRHRYAVIVDEPHHLVAADGDQQERGYTRGVEPLMALAKVRIFMSGTLFRHDRKPIAFLPYDDEGKVDQRETDERWFCRYTIRDAIDDQAVIKTEFHLSNGRASWVYAGEDFEADTLDEDPRALFSALRTEFADQLLRDTIRHWKHWRESHRRSKLLVVCADVPQANRVRKVMLGLGLNPEIATYREDDADDRIERFKGTTTDILITVNKAYEGLDVPQITHIACLTHIRSIPWLNQMLARAWRHDRFGDAYRDQVAFVFAPADRQFREAIQLIWQAFQHRVIETELRGTRADLPDADADGDDDPHERGTITPIDSEVTGHQGETLGGAHWDVEEMGDLLSIQEAVMEQGRAPIPLDQLAAVIRAVRARDREPVGAAPRSNGTSYRTPGQRIQLLRRDLVNNVNTAARLMSQQSGLSVGDCTADINREIVKQWRKRSEMEEDQLHEAILWVRRYYGID